MKPADRAPFEHDYELRLEAYEAYLSVHFRSALLATASGLSPAPPGLPDCNAASALYPFRATPHAFSASGTAIIHRVIAHGRHGRHVRARAVVCVRVQSCACVCSLVRACAVMRVRVQSCACESVQSC